MILKKLFLLIIFLVSLHSQENFKIIEQRKTYIDFESEQATKAWIGLYKKGTNNNWSNVLAWNWVKSSKTRISDISHFKEGDYEARLFFNNSFINEESINFQIPKNSINQTKYLNDKIIRIPYQKSFELSFAHSHYTIGTSWVGIFKKGHSHTRENLLGWSLVYKGCRMITITTLNPKDLGVGLYDIVYFKGNSYQEIGLSATLTIDIKMYHGVYKGKTKDMLIILGYDKFRQTNDWVAIFKSNAKPIRKNILYWAYVKDAEVNRNNQYVSILHFPKFPNFENPENFKIVLFENDSYNILKYSSLHSVTIANMN